MLPAGLHHADPGVRHRREELFEEAGLGDEIGVENENVVAGRRLETRGEGARLVAAAGGAVEDRDVDAPPPPLAGALTGQGGGLVGGVVEDLDLEEVAGVGEAAGGVDEALDDVPLVVGGELDGDGGVGGEGGRGPPVGHRTRPPRKEEQADPVRREGKEEGENNTVEGDRDNAGEVGHSGWSLGVGSNPRHRSTGSGGYLGKVGSSRCRLQRWKTEPRRDVIRRIQAQRAQRPTRSGRSLVKTGIT